MTTVAILNQKGGVGKTTVTLGLASAAQAAGVTTLVVDLDPQANATYALRPALDKNSLFTSDILLGNEDGSAADAVHPSGWGLEVDILPSSAYLQEFESAQIRKDADLRLKTALNGTTDDYGLVLLDCAPSLGRLTRNALAAADIVLVVTEPYALSLRGIDAVELLIKDVAKTSNRGLELNGVVVNKMPGRGLEAERRTKELAEMVGKRNVWQPFIPNRVVMAEAIGDGTPIHWWGYRSRDATEAFDKLFAKLRRTVQNSQKG